MKKYLGFILTLFVALPLWYSAHSVYEKNNIQAIAGNYIQNSSQNKAMNFKIATANALTDQKARESTLENLYAIKKTMVEPAQPLNQLTWYKYYFSEEMTGILSFLLFSTCLILSLIFFVKSVIIEKLSRKRRFFNYR